MPLGRTINVSLSLAGCTAVLFALIGHNLDLDGAPRDGIERTAADAARSAPGRGGAAADAEANLARSSPWRVHTAADSRISIGRIVPSGHRVVNIVKVDWRNDRVNPARARGELVGPLPMTSRLGGVATGGCSFNIQCDDANPCTIDTCNLPPGAPIGFGKCEYDPVPNGAPGECDDGIFCNGKETCQGAECALGSFQNVGLPCDSHNDCRQPGFCNTAAGQCTSGGTGPCTTNDDCGFPGSGTCDPGSCAPGQMALCCGEPDNETVCSEELRRCEPTCTLNGDCNDLLKCNGVETCERTCVGGPAPGIVCTIDANCEPGGVCRGHCRSGLNPCGAGAACFEGDCTQAGSNPCNSIGDCVAPATCNKTAFVCLLGRCCAPGIEPECSKARLEDCDNTGNSQWYPGDDGQQDLAEGCGGGDPLSYEEWGCPKYGRGLSQHDAANPPIYPVMVGPISDSPVCVPAPGGPGGECFNPFDPAGRLFQLGDDYAVTNGSHIRLEVLRFVGGLLGEGSISLEFYDNAFPPNLIEDVVLTNLNPSIGIQVVVFNPHLVIPDTGYVVMRVAGDFAPDTKFVWSSTTNANGVGTNDTNKIWVNDGPTSGAGNFLKMCNGGPRANKVCVTNADCPSGACVPSPGILAFELVGDKVAAPLGACCDRVTGECVDSELSWRCAALENNFHANSLCASCNGGANYGGACRTCMGGGPAGLCTSDAYCSPGTCQPNIARCRTCLGGTGPPGTPCTSAGQCGGGTCPPIGLTCSTGTVGVSCTTNDQCDLIGSCNLETLTCETANVGLACSNDSQCIEEGTCVPVACQATAACSKGACCQTDPVVCKPEDPQACCSEQPNEATCEVVSGRVWQGFGTECDADGGYEPEEQHCCRIPQYSDKRCLGGPNNLQTCTLLDDSECRFCVEGPNNTQSCNVQTDCARCVGGTNDNEVCMVDADCPDDFPGACMGRCLGRCANRGTGGDSCEDAYIHVITVPPPEEGPKTITISGNNDAASSTVETPDSCFGIAAAVTDDPGWFEGFSIDQCARVRIDLCCSDPVRQPAYTFLFPGSPDCDCHNPIPSAPDPYEFGQADTGQGPPYCGEDNVWFTFPLLPEGTYYYPIFSALAGAHGDYQMHVTVQACPTAACCYSVCGSECFGGENHGALCNGHEDCGSGTCGGNGGTNFGEHCDKNATCGGGVCRPGSTNAGNACDEDFDCGFLSNPANKCSVSCLAQCDVVEKDVCDERFGFFLASPNIASAQSVCSPWTCEGGSCCTGPGLCLDQTYDASGIADDDTTMISAVCDEYNGNFIGGVRCAGGTCDTGADAGESCNLSTEGQCVGGSCVGSPLQLAQPNPCPLCDFAYDATCQHDSGTFDGTFYSSDASFTQGATRVVDDFVPTQPGMLEHVCVLGTYAHFPETGGSAHYCGAGNHGDFSEAFTVRVYPADSVTGLPGSLVWFSTTTHVRGLEFTSGQFEFFRHRLELSAPIGPLEAAQTYWIEVVNNTDNGNADELGCDWYWLPANEGAGNGVFLQDHCSVYSLDDAKVGDMALCMNLAFTTPSEPTRACCTGNPISPCAETNFGNCVNQGGSWQVDQASCSGFVCPVEHNDACARAPFVHEGSFEFNLWGSSRDGSASEACADNPTTTMGGDIWYFYQPTASGQAYIGTCDCDCHGDEVVAVYSDGTICHCPGDVGFALLTCRDGAQQNYLQPAAGCPFLGGAADVVLNVTSGNCYTVRVATSAGSVPSRANLRIALNPAKCGNNIREVVGGEQCDGIDDALCPGDCNYNCLCPPTVCGKQCVGGTKDSQACNTLADCPGGTACAGKLEATLGEECDASAGPAGTSPCTSFNTTCRLQGQFGACIGGPDNGQPCDDDFGCTSGTCDGSVEECQCVPICGNGRREGSELCDGADDDLCGASGCNGQCGCNTFCGNGVLEIGEHCDKGGPGMFPPAVDGLCKTRCQANCTCPPPSCGNNYTEILSNNEECDGTDLAGESTCPDSPCRLPGDPLGGCTCACIPPDTDGDGIPDADDNCLIIYNPDQFDRDQDGVGEACDNCPNFWPNADQADSDADGKGNVCDNCPTVPNHNQLDGDGDGIGDACDSDRDNDGVPDSSDNCPDDPNPAPQADADGDGAGDACDRCPGFDDAGDSDSDGVPNACDNCPTSVNPAQFDVDGDGLGDECDPDIDGDQVLNSKDNCPYTPNSGQEDFDNDGIGDACPGGTILLSCEDADDGGHSRGTLSGGLYPRAMSRLYTMSRSPGTGILVIGVNGATAMDGFDSINDPGNSGPGATPTFLTNPSAIATVTLSDYRLIYIASDGINTFGGITSSQMDALNTRRDDIAFFVNELGGGLIALTESGLANGWGWLPISLVFAPPQFSNVFPTAALAQLAPDATAENMSHCCYHCIFTGPPGFSGLGVLARRLEEGQEPVVLGGFGVTLTSENCNNGIDDDGDGLSDCDDPDCDHSPNCFESNCRNTIDDDNDGPVDCSDPDCNGDPFCTAGSPIVVWDPIDAHTRSITFTMTLPATATPGQSAIQVTMVDLEHPVPAYQPSANPLPKNFTTFDTRSNGACTNGDHMGHHCDTSADCRLCGGVGANTNRPCASDTDCPGGFCPTSTCTGDARRPCSTNGNCTGFGTCGAPIVYACGGLAACTGEAAMNPTGVGGCGRWVGKPERFREAQEIDLNPVDYLGARLQCTPYYHDWVTATASEKLSVFGAEILPNSRYNVVAYSSSCKGEEAGCDTVSAAVEMLTRRHGDVVSAYNPPATTQQPDATDIGQLVAKFKKQPGSPSNSSALIQPNVPDGNADVGASDIVQGVDAAKQFVYSFGGPCPCPSLAVCGAVPCPAGAGTCIGSGAPGLGPESTCIKLCRGGTNDGEQCNNHKHCGGGGVCDKECLGGANVGLGCSSNGDCPGSTCAVVTNNAFCRDKCGRCTP